MSKQTQVKTVAVELAKTVGGFMAGRVAANMGEKALKVNEETDPKKKKMKEVGVGVGVAAIGTAVAVKAPDDFKSVGAGMATAGLVSAMSPFGKEDKGFIPVLHGMEDEGYEYIPIETELNGETEEQQIEREYLEMEAEEEANLDALSSLEDEEEVDNGTEVLN